ncbi:MAG: hypothetical protein AB8H03_19115 [Saprospiraceae bacterium]
MIFTKKFKVPLLIIIFLSIKTIGYSQEFRSLGHEQNVFKCVLKNYIQINDSFEISTIKEFIYNRNGNLDWIFEYDQNRNQIGASKFTNYERDSIIENHYNEKSNLDKVSKYYFPNDSTTIYQYDNGKNLVQDTTIKVNPNLLIFKRSTGVSYDYFEFDSKGNVVSQISKNSNSDTSLTSSLKYLEFDNKENWTKCENNISWDSYKTNLLIERTLTYYDSDTLDNLYEIITTDIVCEKSIEDHFSHSEFDMLYDKKFYDENYFYLFNHSNQLSEKRIYRLTLRNRAEIIDLKTNHIYSYAGKNRDWSENDDFYRLRKMLGFIPKSTGVTKKINNILCEEYILKNESEFIEHFYIDKSRPYMDYGNFRTLFPGFVVKSIRRSYNGVYEWTVETRKTEYQPEFFEGINSFFNKN